MAKAKKPEIKFIAVDNGEIVVSGAETLPEVVSELRELWRDSYMYDEDGSLGDYIEDQGIVVYEVVAALKIEEKVTRTILINGQPASF